MPFSLSAILTYAGSVHCKCAMMQRQRQIFNYLHFLDTVKKPSK